MPEDYGHMAEIDTLWNYFKVTDPTSMEHCAAYKAFLDIVEKAYGYEGIRYIRRLRERDKV